MTEPIRRVRLEPEPARASSAGDPFALDVLLIADEPWGSKRRSGRRAIAAGRVESIEPLDMETVVRKLIAVLSEESQP
jgi:hypothetical protein